MTSPSATTTSGITPEDIERLRAALAVANATEKAGNARGWNMLREVERRPGDNFVLAVYQVPETATYKGLKLEDTTWQMVGETVL